ncbi:DDE_3 domain-containing protein [Trichonephila clavipes]|nr:DDE_3 domain-containing protein [Trichonephila clavipes]
MCYMSLGGRTDLRVFPRGDVNAPFYRDDILNAYVCPFAWAILDAFVLQDDNGRPHNACIVDVYLEPAVFQCMRWPARSLDLTPIEHV